MPFVTLYTLSEILPTKLDFDLVASSDNRSTFKPQYGRGLSFFEPLIRVEENLFPNNHFVIQR